MKRWIPLTISQKIVFFRIFSSKVKNIFVSAFTFVLDSFGLFYGDFYMDFYSVDSEEAMKHKGFIASIFKYR